MTLLKDIVQIEKGRKHNLIEENQEGAIRVFQANDFRNENKPLYTIDPDGVLAEEDDIMLVWDGSVGQMGFGRSGYVGSTMVKLKVKNKKQFSPLFIYRFLQTKSDYLKRKATGATIMHINRKSLEQLEIPDLDIATQLHIANVLSKAENLIAQRKESIRLLDEFLKSTFLEMFGDLKGEKVPLSTACIVNPKKSEINSMDKSIDVSFVPMAFVSENGEVDLSQTRKLGSVWNGFTYFRENDVVFAKITPCMENGKGAIMRNLKNKIGFGTTEFHVLRPIKGVSTAEWIYHLTIQHWFRKKAEQNMSGSAGQKRVPTDYFDKVRVVIPPLELQTQFARIVEKTEALKTQYKQSLQELENLYGSLSQRAFRGELSV
jgi:type I restriction enzyme S subunit